ncbi:MAG: rhamnulokinase [Clostridia bacterium]|nr:rhamnulokinase [Clostridia bacterium]
MKKIKMLAIDLGASSGRGIVGTFDGEKITLEENHRFPNEPVMVAGQYTWDIVRILHEIKTSIRKCATGEDRDIDSIGIDTWGVDFGFLDKRGHLLANPVHYRDLRTVGIPAYSEAYVSADEVYGITGIQVLELNSLYQLLAVQKNSPEIFDIATDMLFVPDLLNYFLTGYKQTEYTIASTSQLLDAKKRNWSDTLIKKFGLPEKLFSKIVPPGTVCGNFLPSLSEEFGGINPKVISVAAHDTGSAVLAVPAKNEKFIWISSGTWSIMGTETKDPVISEKSKEYNFTNEGGYGDTIRFSKNITGLWVEQESKRQWEREGEKISFAELAEMAAEAEPLRCFIDPDDARFATPGNIPKRIADYCRETGQFVPQTKGEIVRCILESLAMRYRYTVECIDEMCGERIPAINIVGGGTKEEQLSQFAATACGRPVYAGPVEATAIGNIAAQAIALGAIKDMWEAREIIANSFEIKEYQPETEKMAAWDEAYGRFLKLIEK